MSDQRFYFISGLPRSGSTMLSAILRQNPSIEAGMTSPVGAITGSIRTLMSQNREVDALIDDIGRLKILRGIFDGYYSETDKPIIFDTNRGWTGRIPELKFLFPDVKIIAMVRDPAWILDSLERITRTNPVRQSGMIRPGSSIDTRTSHFMGADGIVGSALSNLKEAFFGPDADKLLLIEYDALCAAPDEVLAAIYEFIGEKKFEHDFSDLEYEQETFDAALRTPGLHTVSGPVQPRERVTVLPPDIFERFSSTRFWGPEADTRSSRIIC